MTHFLFSEKDDNGRPLLDPKGQFAFYQEPVAGTDLYLPNSSPRRIRVLLAGPETAELATWRGLAGDIVEWRVGTVFAPLPSEGDDPEGYAFKCHYMVREGGYNTAVKIRE